MAESDHELQEPADEAQDDSEDGPTVRDLPRVNNFATVITHIESWMEQGGYEDSHSNGSAVASKKKQQPRSFLAASLEYRTSAPEDRAFLDDEAVHNTIAQRQADRDVVPLHSDDYRVVPAGAPLLSPEELRRHHAIMQKALGKIKSGRKKRQSTVVVDLETHRHNDMDLDPSMEEAVLEVISMLRDESRKRTTVAEDEEASTDRPASTQRDKRTQFRIPLHLGIVIGMAASQIRREVEETQPPEEEVAGDNDDGGDGSGENDGGSDGNAPAGGCESNDRYLGLLARVGSAIDLSHRKVNPQVRVLRDAWDAVELEQRMERACEIIVEERASLQRDTTTSSSAPASGTSGAGKTESIRRVSPRLREALNSAYADFREWRKRIAAFRKQLPSDEADTLLKLLRESKAPVATLTRCALACCEKLGDGAPAQCIRDEIEQPHLHHVELLLCYMETDDGSARDGGNAVPGASSSSGSSSAIGTGFSGSQSTTLSSHDNSLPVLTMGKAKLILDPAPVASTKHVQRFYDLLWSLLSGLLSRSRIKSLVKGKRAEGGGKSPTPRGRGHQSTGGSSTASSSAAAAKSAIKKHKEKGNEKHKEKQQKEKAARAPCRPENQSGRHEVLARGALLNPPVAAHAFVNERSQVVGDLQVSSRPPSGDAPREPIEDPDDEVQFVGVFGPRDNSDAAWNPHRRVAGASGKRRRSDSQDAAADVSSPSAKRRKG